MSRTVMVMSRQPSLTAKLIRLGLAMVVALFVLRYPVQAADVCRTLASGLGAVVEALSRLVGDFFG